MDATLLTAEEAVRRQETREDYCPSFQDCEKDERLCVHQIGLKVAQYVKKGKSLKDALLDLAEADFFNPNEEFRDSENRREFVIINGSNKAVLLRAVEKFARYALGMNPNESFLNQCTRCYGSLLEEIVYDSVHLKIRAPGVGTGETKARKVIYCPSCDPKPIGGIVYVNF